MYIFGNEKLILDKHGKIRKTESVVQGRKQPLEEIRKTLKIHERFLRVNPDEFDKEQVHPRTNSSIDKTLLGSCYSLAGRVTTQ